MERFKCGWDKLKLPIEGIVAVIDKGEPAVGLSAMQLTALDVNNGIVKVGFGKNTCEAKVWNAGGMTSTKGFDTIRITDSLAKQLGCKEGDKIKFLEVVVYTLPVVIGPIG